MDHNYAPSNEERAVKNINFDHGSYVKKPLKTLKAEEEKFFFFNIENFPEVDQNVIKRRLVQSMALAGAVCDINYEFQDEVINNMGDYNEDLNLLDQIYLQDLTTQLTHTPVFKVNPQILVIFSNSLFDPDKGILNPDTGQFEENTKNLEAEIERHIWLPAFQIDGQTDLVEIIQEMKTEFRTRIEESMQGPSGLIYTHFLSTVLAYSISIFEYGGCDIYEMLPDVIKQRKAIISVNAVKNDCFKQTVLYHFNHKKDPRVKEVNFSSIQLPTNFNDIKNFEIQNPWISINVLTLSFNENDIFSHFEPKYISRNTVIDQEDENKTVIPLLYYENHFSYINDIGKLLGKRNKDGIHRRSHFCYTCLTIYWSASALKVIQTFRCVLVFL